MNVYSAINVVDRDVSTAILTCLDQAMRSIVST